MAINFIKNAGESLWDKVTGKDKEREKSQKITQFINGLGISISDLSADVNKDTVTIKGTTKTQEDREKVILAAGNVKGVSHVNDNIKVIPDRQDQEGKQGEENGKQESRFYTVNKGDTLSAIAQRFYGNASKYPQIFEANRPMLKDPNKIYPGQTLRIPN